MEVVLAQASQAGRSAEEILREEGELTSEQLARATAERFGLDYVDMNVFKPDLTAVSLVSSSAAKRYSAVPVGPDAAPRPPGADAVGGGRHPDRRPPAPARGPRAGAPRRAAPPARAAPPRRGRSSA